MLWLGILRLMVCNGVGLKKANFFSSDSDPFVKINSFDQFYKTSIKFGQLNPVWDETFDVLIFDKNSQKIEFTVADNNQAKADTIIGTVYTFIILEKSIFFERIFF
jgi:Ca2+-dependent lipid-binding protein